MDAILHTAFVSDTAVPKAAEIGDAWEEWVREHLGEYIDVLPYSRLDLLDYTTEMALSVGNPRDPLAFAKHVRGALSSSFPSAEMANATSVRGFLDKYSNETPEFKAIGLVYAYNLRRQAGLPEERKGHVDPVRADDQRAMAYARSAHVVMRNCTRWNQENTEKAMRTLQSQWEQLNTKEKASVHDIRQAVTALVLQ